jgi:hypothetical protein
MARRRTAAELAYLRQVAWDFSRFNHYAGNYRCTGPCGRVVFCVGKYRESVKCRECSGLPNGDA